MTPEQFRRSLGKSPPAPAYFFTGVEAALKQEALGALAALVPAATRAFNVQIFHAFEADLTEVLTAARTLPFLAPRRVVVLREIEKMRLTEGRGARLEEYLAAPAPETVFVVTTEDAEKAKGLGKQHEGRWTVVHFKPLTAAELAAAVRAEAARLGCTIDGAAAAALVEATGLDRGRAFNELDKLRSAVGAGGAIDRDTVARYAAGYEHHGHVDIVDALSRRDLAACLRLLREVTLKDEEFLGLLGMIGKRLRVLWYLAGGAREVPAEFRLYPSQIEKLQPDARRFTREELERGLDGLRRVDDGVKSTAVAPKLLLEHFLLGFLPGSAQE